MEGCDSLWIIQIVNEDDSMHTAIPLWAEREPTERELEVIATEVAGADTNAGDEVTLLGPYPEVPNLGEFVIPERDDDEDEDDDDEF